MNGKETREMERRQQEITRVAVHRTLHVICHGGVHSIYVLVRIRMTIHSRTKYFCRFRSACLFVGDDEHTQQKQQRQYCVYVCDADAAKWRNCDRCRPIPKLLIIWFVYQFIFSVRRMCRMYVVYMSVSNRHCERKWERVSAARTEWTKTMKKKKKKKQKRMISFCFVSTIFTQTLSRSLSVCVMSYVRTHVCVVVVDDRWWSDELYTPHTIIIYRLRRLNSITIRF